MTQSFICYTYDVEVTLKVTNLMVSLSEDSTFEEFTDGPSPNPNYPQEIETVGNNINILPDKEHWEQGSVDNKTGEPFSSTTRLRNKGFIGVEPKTNYFASLQNDDYAFINIILYDNKGTYIKDYYSINNAIKGANALLITIPENCYNIKVILKNADDTSNITVDEYPQIKAKFEKGDIQTPYSVYSQGSVEVIKQNKNLLNKNLLDRNVSYSYGTVGVVPQPWRGLKNRGALSPENAIKIKPNTSYVFTVPTGIRFGVAQLESDLKSLGDTGWLLSTKSPYTLVTQPNAQYIGFNFGKDDNSDFTDSEWDNFVNGHLQFEEGTVATNFVEHREETYILPVQQEMLEGDYIDNVEHHEWHKLILNGTENVIRIAANHGKYIFGIDTELQAISTKSEEIKEIYCNVATQNSRGFLFSNITADWISYGSDNNYYRDIVLSCMNTYNMTVEEFKAWIKERYDAGNPVVIYYQLATPIELELTDEQKAISKYLQPYDNGTTILVTDKLATITASYTKKGENNDEN